MKLSHLVAGLCVTCASVGCIVAPFEPPQGIVASYSAPLSTEGNWKAGSRSGKAEAICVLGLVAVGDCSLTAAIKNGGLKEAYYADYRYFNVLGIYQSVSVNVTGE